jgi:hypothetical protein
MDMVSSPSLTKEEVSVFEQDHAVRKWDAHQSPMFSSPIHVVKKLAKTTRNFDKAVKFDKSTALKEMQSLNGEKTCSVNT